MNRSVCCECCSWNCMGKHGICAVTATQEPCKGTLNSPQFAEFAEDYGLDMKAFEGFVLKTYDIFKVMGWTWGTEKPSVPSRRDIFVKTALLMQMASSSGYASSGRISVTFDKKEWEFNLTVEAMEVIL